jgi:hypothetical protein
MTAATAAATWTGPPSSELVHGANFATWAEARVAIVEYIEVFFNTKRRHSSLGYVSPASCSFLSMRLRFRGPWAGFALAADGLIVCGMVLMVVSCVALVWGLL